MASLEDILSELEGAATGLTASEPLNSGTVQPKAAVVAESGGGLWNSIVEAPDAWVTGASQPAPGARPGNHAPSVGAECTRHAALAQLRAAARELCQGAALEAAIRGGTPKGRLPSAPVADAKTKPLAAPSGSDTPLVVPGGIDGALEQWLVSSPRRTRNHV
jgi:hypothetical protein